VTSGSSGVAAERKKAKYGQLYWILSATGKFLATITTLEELASHGHAA